MMDKTVITTSGYRCQGCGEVLFWIDRGAGAVLSHKDASPAPADRVETIGEPNGLTIGMLREMLAEIPPEMDSYLVTTASDPEGNDFHVATEVSVGWYRGEDERIFRGSRPSMTASSWAATMEVATSEYLLDEEAYLLENPEPCVLDDRDLRAFCLWS